MLLAIALLSVFTQPAEAQPGASHVLVITYDGPVTPAMVEYVERGLRVAEQRGADLVVFQLNTPGGGIILMNQVVQLIRASEIPVVVYVWPRGGMAASAGALITIAGHASAMAPETIIGAASPVGGQGEDLDETAAAKERGALIATVESLMENRPPEAIELARDMIETARAVSVDEALEVGLIDYKARNLDNLLNQLDGTSLLVNNRTITFDLAEAEVENLDPSLIESLLQLLTNPNIVFLLLTIGIQALLIELYTPGGWVAGFIGVVCLALAIYGLGVLPVNWFGLIFLLTSFVLFVLEIKAPTHGALTAAGVGSLIIGALVLFNSPGTPDFQRISIPVVVAVSLGTAAVFFVIVTYAVRSLRAPVRTGQESLVGATGTVRVDLNPSGSVHVNAEEWTAELAPGESPLPKGARIQVVRVVGIRLIVKHLEETDLPDPTLAG
jgi:membrane-bound serine protease (ClpP class)